MASEKKPIIFSVDDDPQVLRSIKRDLRREFKKEYRIINDDSPLQALESLKELKKKGEEVALLLSDQRMPGMIGVDFLEKAKALYPNAKRVLLTAYSDKDVAIRAINETQLDYYLMKPWDPPEEKMYPVLNDLLDDWHNSVVPSLHGLRLIGRPYSPKSHRIKDFLAGNLIPYQWLDIIDNPKAKEALELHNLNEDELPVLVVEDGTALQDPSLQDIARKVGLNPKAQSELYDVVIIGAGPAGLAAAVYGGSEGLKTLLIERRAPGGQAGTSSRIENYLGFPKGVSGSELSRRAITQATRFGVEFLSPQEVTNVNTEGEYKILELGDGSKVNAKAVIVTTGVDYRRHPATGIEGLTGSGIYYGAAMTEANSCKDRHVFVVGGGNSAGQGAVYLSKFAKQVTILIRRPDLTTTMSSYLIDQINDIPNIKVEGYRQVLEAKGNGKLESLTIENMEDQSQLEVPADALFIFIGARPCTVWLAELLLRDEKGYVRTGKDLIKLEGFQKSWPREREPYMLETCKPGIFAAGDVRSGAMNRVASAVGEGAMAIKFVHEYLAEL